MSRNEQNDVYLRMDLVWYGRIATRTRFFSIFLAPSLIFCFSPIHRLRGPFQAATATVPECVGMGDRTEATFTRVTFAIVREIASMGMPRMHTATNELSIGLTQPTEHNAPQTAIQINRFVNSFDLAGSRVAIRTELIRPVRRESISIDQNDRTKLVISQWKIDSTVQSIFHTFMAE